MNPAQPQLRISCAASLSKAVQQTAEVEGLAILLNSGGSNALVRQASLGSPTDLLLLAGDKMARESLLPKGYRLTAIASNRLVLIAPAEDTSPQNQSDFVRALTDQEGRLAVADAKTAPLGAYTQQALEGLDVSSRLVPTPDAQAVLSAVALAHLDRGIVYKSDAMSNSKVRVICEIPANLHDPVIYVAAVAPDAHQDSQRMVDTLVAGKGAQILTRLGFLPAPR